jgi:MHS family proline/betaine transporter-like MFS transporter
MMAYDIPATSLTAGQSRRALVAGSVGNFIEWYEFGVYGYLATVIAGNFFTLEGQSGLTGLLCAGVLLSPDWRDCFRPHR